MADTQPQAHVQLVCNLVDYGMDPQAAIDAPRFHIKEDEGKPVNNPILFEESWPDEVLAALTEMGHPVDPPKVSSWGREKFGRAQIIVRDPATGVLCAGSDGRADGCAMGW